MTQPVVAHVKCENRVAILVLKSDAGELVYEEVDTPVEKILNMLEADHAKHVLVDFAGSDYFGSHVVECLLQLYKKAKSGGGWLALATVSAHEMEILKLLSLDKHWPIFDSTEAALESMETD